MTIGRAIVIVLDSVGVGELPDAADYGDAGANTLAHVAEAVGGLNLPNLEALGLGNVTAISGVAPRQSPIGCFGKMAEVSIGKDTATGHWELMGVITLNPFPTYPNGFPDEIIKEFESRIGRRTIGNKVASGTEIIAELGDEHLRTGCPIVYTSVDSVFQIACHEQVIPLDELYKMCEIARSILVDPHNIQRVIARPFVGSMGVYTRTPRRRDYALPPPHDTLLDLLSKGGGQVIGIGKIEDIFSGRGVSVSHHTSGNLDGIEKTISAVSSGQGDLIFTNLVDFDSLYGHRNDADGYAHSLQEFDTELPRIISAMLRSDCLLITADHGCDPTIPGTDHTREYVPLLVYGESIEGGVDLGTRSSFCDLSATIATLLSIDGPRCGESFADLLKID